MKEDRRSISYQDCYDIIALLVREEYIPISDYPLNEVVHHITSEVIEKHIPLTFDKEEYTINLLRDVKRLLSIFDL